MSEYDGWELIGTPIGEGGQGIVYKARRPERVKQLNHIAGETEKLLHQFSAVGPTVSVTDLARRIVEIGSPDPLEHIGALKIFKIPPNDKDEEKRAIGRLESEILALQKVKHPAVVKLLYSNLYERFIVTEFHPDGTLDNNLGRYQGDALAALGAFRALVEGVMNIHNHGAIHRDIKPENIFVAASGNLVLGDFGIVFFEGARLTKTRGERVGTHYWMAPWAYDNVRLELPKISPKLDIYPLGKVLWAMIYGKNGFPFWEYSDDTNNLEKRFPADPSMALVNELLGKVFIVRRESECKISDAAELLSAVEGLIESIKALSGYRPDDTSPWPCRICGRGNTGIAGPKSRPSAKVCR